MTKSTLRHSLLALFGPLLLVGGCMQERMQPASPTGTTAAKMDTTSAPGEVRYIVSDVDRSITFYTQQLGFHVDQKAGTAFASVSRGNLQLILSGPGSSGARPMPDGRRQEPGGYNRIVLYVDDLASTMDRLKGAGTRFRNQVESGPGGKQIQIEDPDGNPIELHQR